MLNAASHSGAKKSVNDSASYVSGIVTGFHRTEAKDARKSSSSASTLATSAVVRSITGKSVGISRRSVVSAARSVGVELSHHSRISGR